MADHNETNKAIVRKFVDALNARDFEALDVIISPNYFRHSFAGPGIGSLAELKAYFRSEFESFPDAIETIQDMIAEGGRVAVRISFRGTQTAPMGQYPATGKVMAVDYLAIYRIENGKIVEGWAEWDNLAGLRQLGTSPAAGIDDDRGNSGFAREISI